MNIDNLHDALGLLDDELIEEVERLRSERKQQTKRRSRKWIVRWTSLAAGLVLFVVSAYAVSKLFLRGFGSAKNSDSSEIMVGENIKEESAGVGEDNNDSAQQQGIVVSDNTSGATGESKAKTLVIPVTDFAIRLFQASAEEGKNTLVSPLSVVSALGMTANGAKEDTLSQMESVLGMQTEELNNYLYSYMKALPQEENYKLNLANSIWFTDDERFTVKEGFLQLNEDYYGADIYRAPFDNTTVKDINSWVKNKTDDMIPEILNKIPQNAVMYLVNALAFEAEWAKIYKEDQVHVGVFTLEDGATQEATFMYGEESSYLEDEKAAGFLKYYKDHKYAFVALLPNEDISIAEYVATLDGEKLNKLLENRQETTVSTAIPKFKTEYSTEMSEVLSGMGMSDAFDKDKANFTGLGTYKGNIYIDQVLHKTFISVGEKGTKAGAATVVAMAGKTSAVMEEPKIVYLDRPFVYMLIDCENNIPFFVGTMMNVNE